MVSLARHFVPNPVLFKRTDPRIKCQCPLFLHTRYDAANQLTVSEDSSGTTTYAYDLSGNQELQEDPAGARTTNTWDAENRLTLVQAPSNVINTMTYRADGLRVEKQDSAGTSKFIWDGQNILLETAGTDATQAVYTLQPLGVGKLVSQRRGATSSFFHFDALGSTRELTDAAESIADTYLYRAYGKLVTSNGSTTNPFRWVGRLGYFYDGDLLQYYIRARHYDPATGRWMSEDPIGSIFASSARYIVPAARGPDHYLRRHDHLDIRAFASGAASSYNDVWPVPIKM